VAVDRSGDVATSTDPTGGAMAWDVARVDALAHYDVSCPSVSLCVAVGENGDLLVSTNPAGGPSAWKVRRLDAAVGSLHGVSCTPTACVAVGNLGSIASTSDPAGGASAWRTIKRAPSVNELSDVSCPSQSLCVAVGGYVGHLDENPVVLTSTHPLGGAAKWIPYSGVDLRSVDCPSASFCGGTTGFITATSTDPTNPMAWNYSNPQELVEPVDVSCPSAGLCVVVGYRDSPPDPTGISMFGTPGGAGASAVSP
jgi:hypothetical protein